MSDEGQVFDIPVKVRLREGAKARRIASAHEAYVLLESADWPADQSQAHRDACGVAEDALAGHREDAEVFDAFSLAAKEPGILVESSIEDGIVPSRFYFESIVCVQPRGGSTVREVKSVNGACEVLIDWPHVKRGPYYQSAREVVHAALDGKATPDQAREAFALAGHAGILVERGI
ncbi:DUF982 domain-containing protein [Mesorhizobium sp. STM 4661]|uniref:DUF982 domain-containing protein n=1 Tax=Mesorhizobium sp. STM 4661 TaxID=1297570 RepID=UPI0009D9779B|nr:DUF982 domain-containing protein [Mesorhizobium sp. STM 4661]